MKPRAEWKPAPEDEEQLKDVPVEYRGWHMSSAAAFELAGGLVGGTKMEALMDAVLRRRQLHYHTT